ncbi:MFS transporter [Pseudonocardia charpentierae]|uniref:MFS transporter n=1 Tax=Pseudonocardia charpentierae TaxID=3075545 RepID=A0ABU2NE15_9PSEU|nr:MFS transporter [Pseudonocardia sp. DSM 45834]MDT0352203.1 MFS transporter [Pseudonocardia sp. DSM 45834]
MCSTLPLENRRQRRPGCRRSPGRPDLLAGRILPQRPHRRRDDGHRRPVPARHTSCILFAGTMIAYFFFTTQFLHGVYGYSPLQAGLAFLPMTVVNFFVALPVPRLTARFGNAALLASGLAVTLAGMSWLAQLTAAAPYLTGVALPMVLIGIGQGLAFAPLTAAGLAGATARDAGAASGLVNTTHQLGSTLGVAVLVALSSDVGAATLADRVTTAYSGGAVMLAAALVAVLVLIVPAEAAARRYARDMFDSSHM